ncbi:putative 7-deoxyloganetin glucosyltransferase [Helianthus annuus]|nr:putative 7-deoxyloganetin glucosyltransferase [Helianthus annuus]
MGSKKEKKPHALCIPVPVQGHISPMLKLAKILHSQGFLITFVNTEFNHQRLLRSQGPQAVRGLPSFRFETIPDGLPSPQNLDATQDVPSLARAIEENLLDPFKTLVTKINSSSSPVTCIVADVLMGFTLDAASELGIPEFMFWTSGAGSLLCIDQFTNLLEKGLMPLKGMNFYLYF